MYKQNNLQGQARTHIMFISGIGRLLQFLAYSSQMNATSTGNILNALQNYTRLACAFEDVLRSECNLVCVLQDDSSIKAEQGKRGQLGDSL